MRKQRIGLSLLLIIFLVWPHHIYAEFYKYIDKDGVLRFVDEPGKIPPEYRENIKPYQEKYDRLSGEEKSTLLEKERQEEMRRQEEQLAIARARDEGELWVSGVLCNEARIFDAALAT